MAAIGHNSGLRKSMFAIVFDLDTNSLKDVYGGPSWNNAYSEVRAFLTKRGLGCQHGRTYFGDETVNEVSCVLTIQDLAETFDWFAPSVRDVRMLRIESNNDLMPAVERARSRKAG